MLDTRSTRVTFSSSTATQLSELCQFAPATGSEEEVVFWFSQVVRWLRPRRNQRLTPKLRFLATRLENNPAWKVHFAGAINRLVNGVDVERLLTYGGIAQSFHLSGAIREWFLTHALPAACKTDDGAQIGRLAFKAADRTWVGNDELMAFVVDMLEPATRQRVSASVSASLKHLGHQIMAQADSPNVKQLSSRERSPYQSLYDAIMASDSNPGDDRALRALQGRIRECIAFLHSHRAELAVRGADLNTTFQLSRLEQQLTRLSVLAKLRHEDGPRQVAATVVMLVHKVVRIDGGRRLLARSTELVIRNLVDTAASVGRRYLREETSSFAAAFRAGLGGGALMAFAAVFKFFIGRMHLSPFYEGVAYSFNYGAVFCAAFLLHYTIATKLPAHTAAALAQAVQDGEGFRKRLRAFLTVWRTALRLQIAGLCGNLVVAGPLAFILDRIWTAVAGSHLLDPEKARHVMESQSIWGPSAAYAALAGVFLWISSLIAAAGDNWVRVVRLSDRIATNKRVMRLMNPTRARAKVDQILAQAGGLLGNASLGILLGAVPAVFAIGRLPIEIRHITVSTSSVALAISAGAHSASQVGLALLGLVAIALVNVGVSFSLALTLALSAARNGRSATSASALVRIGLRSAPFGSA